MALPEGGPQPLSAEGPAFPLTTRVLATALVGWMAYWGLRSGGALAATDWNPTALAVFIGALVLVLWVLVWMWRSRTGVDAQGIHQTWIWNKRVAWTDIAQAKLIAVPGLEWLVAPRLMVRARGGGLLVFHSAHRVVLASFACYAGTGVPLLQEGDAPRG
ncbi:hypothetical protein ACT80S_01615 [Ramlibacter sp. MAHUQ-53]|uniref:hypothetical protein n=1 Tax=unclassified Ramlibacter TaxID=2617605 RepID=UPI003641BAA0